MVKVGLIGSVNSIADHLHKVQSIDGIQVIGKSSVGMIGQADNKFLSVPEYNRRELIEKSDILIVDQTSLIYPDLLIFAIKNNKHTFIFDFPDITPDETAELCKLAEEAKTAVYIENPLLEEPVTDWLFKNLKEPAYISFFDAKNEYQGITYSLLKYIFYASALFHSSPQKIRICGIHQAESSAGFINIRFDYSSNSALNLELLIQNHIERTIKAAIPGKFLTGDLITNKALLNNKNLAVKELAHHRLFSFLVSANSENYYQLSNLDIFLSSLLTLQNLLGKMKMYTAWH